MMVNPRRLEVAAVPKRFWDASIDDFNETVQEQVGEYCENLKEHRQDGVGLIIVGPPGVGKSRLAAAVLISALEEGHSGYYMLLAFYQHRLLRMQTLEKFAARGDQEADREARDMDQVFMKWRNQTEFVVLDDVGKEHTTGTRHIEDEFDYFLRLRYDKGLPTIMTSNKAVSSWGLSYLDSMESFIHEAFQIVVLEGDDYRLRR